MERFNNISEFFSYLLDVPTTAWRYHLATDSYSEHMALNDFYDEIQEEIDSLIECYFGKYGKLGYLAPLEYPFANVNNPGSLRESLTMSHPRTDSSPSLRTASCSRNLMT